MTSKSSFLRVHTSAVADTNLSPAAGALYVSMATRPADAQPASWTTRLLHRLRTIVSAVTRKAQR